MGSIVVIEGMEMKTGRGYDDAIKFDKMGAGGVGVLLRLLWCCLASFCCKKERFVSLKQSNKAGQLRSLDRFGSDLLFHF